MRTFATATPRPDLSPPPPGPVPWLVHDSANPSCCAVVRAQAWIRARELGQIELGVPYERVVAKRAPETE